MHCVRFEDVLMDVYDNEREINRLADMLVEYELEELRLMCAAGVDAVQFGDDFGTARAMLFSPEVWRSFSSRATAVWSIRQRTGEKPCFPYLRVRGAHSGGPAGDRRERGLAAADSL